MAAITLEVAKKHLETWLEAETEVAINQAYTIGVNPLQGQIWAKYESR